MRLSHALLLLLVSVLVAGILPAGLLLERRLGEALIEGARAELAAAPMILKDRVASETTVRMMHARDYAAMPELVRALKTSDVDDAARMLEAASLQHQEFPVLVRADGTTVVGPGPLPGAVLEAARRGEMPVRIVSIGEGLHLLALAPVAPQGSWLGAVGGSTPFGEDEAAELAGLTRSDVVVLHRDGRLLASTADAPFTRLATDRRGSLEPGVVHELQAAGGEPGVLATAELVDEGYVVFLRGLDETLAVLPELHRTAVWSTAFALAFALLVGWVFAHRLARPVAELADAAAGFAERRDDIPVRPSSLAEVRRLSEAFAQMREALSARLAELEHANRELEDRQTRLAALQAEVAQRERLASSGRVLAQLAHEIRNPVASVRNCLEVVRRQGNLQGEARQFADMAVAELLRMHELAERMLDLHRPRSGGDAACDAGELARETAQLLRAGATDHHVEVEASGDLAVRMPREALKQVLLNLLLNAREAAPSNGSVRVVVARDSSGDSVRLEVLDRGPGIPAAIADRIFDPFFTTKDDVHGVGLGLYTAESLVRAAGGVLEAASRTDGPGSRFTVILPVAAR